MCDTYPSTHVAIQSLTLGCARRQYLGRSVGWHSVAPAVQGAPRVSQGVGCFLSRSTCTCGGSLQSKLVKKNRYGPGIPAIRGIQNNGSTVRPYHWKMGISALRGSVQRGLSAIRRQRSDHLARLHVAPDGGKTLSRSASNKSDIH